MVYVIICTAPYPDEFEILGIFNTGFKGIYDLYEDRFPTMLEFIPAPLI